MITLHVDSSLLEEDVCRVRREQQRKSSVALDTTNSKDSFGPDEANVSGLHTIDSIPALQIVSRWLDSMQELLVGGLVEDIKVIAMDIIVRHVRSKCKPEILNNENGHLAKSNISNVCIGDEIPDDIWSDISVSEHRKCEVDSIMRNDWDSGLFDQLGGNKNTDEHSNAPSTLVETLSDPILLKQWLEEHEPSQGAESFIIPPDLLLPLVREAARRQVELELFAPLENYIRLIISDVCLVNDCELSENLHKMRNYTQADFGIPDSIQSPTKWSEIATMMRNMFAKSIPFDRIQALKVAVKQIPLVYEKERNARDRISGKKSPKHIGADDMLPIFIFLLATSELPFGLCGFGFEINSFCDGKLKISETGYILATFEASVQHLVSMKEADGTIRPIIPAEIT